MIISVHHFHAMWYLLLASVAASHRYHCDTNSDCELLGHCVSGACNCFPGFKGPSCAQIDLKPKSVSTGMAAWPPENGYALKNESRRAYGWGFSVAPDTKSQGLLHAVANVGCYLPHDNGMVTGTFLVHLTSTKGPMGPWKAVGIVAPPVSFNAHLRLAPSGQYVLFLRAGLPMPSPTNWEEVACAGVSDTEWKAMVAKGPYITADQLQDPIGNYVATADSMEGIWEAKPFHVCEVLFCARI